jgi:hypothetical protein
MKIQDMRPAFRESSGAQRAAAADVEKEQPRPAVNEVSELDEHAWAVVSFDRVEAGGLTRHEAVRRMEELDRAGVAGLCIVTKTAAERMRS